MTASDDFPQFSFTYSGSPGGSVSVHHMIVTVHSSASTATIYESLVMDFCGGCHTAFQIASSQAGQNRLCLKCLRKWQRLLDPFIK